MRPATALETQRQKIRCSSRAAGEATLAGYVNVWQSMA